MKSHPPRAGHLDCPGSESWRCHFREETHGRMRGPAFSRPPRDLGNENDISRRRVASDTGIQQTLAGHPPTRGPGRRFLAARCPVSAARGRSPDPLETSPGSTGASAKVRAAIGCQFRCEGRTFPLQPFRASENAGGMLGSRKHAPSPAHTWTRAHTRELSFLPAAETRSPGGEYSAAQAVGRGLSSSGGSVVYTETIRLNLPARKKARGYASLCHTEKPR